jgi:hypothetical protein
MNEQTYTSFYRPTFDTYGMDSEDCPNWTLFVLVVGAPAASFFRVRLVVNYEFIPKENSIDIVSANPSPCDSTELGLTESWVATEAVTRPATIQEMSKAPGAGVEAKLPQDGGPSGFGMFVDVLTEILPYAIEGIASIL